jgi:hypothetical protein
VPISAKEGRMTDRRLSNAAWHIARRASGTALGCLIVGVVVWPLFPLGVALGLTAGAARVVAETLEECGL